MPKICSIKCVKLDRKITLQSITRISDSQGGFTETWADVVALWAQIKPLKAYEKYQFSQNATNATHEVMIRYRAGVTNKMRFIYDNRTFYIKEVLNIEEADAYLKITAMELV